MPRADACRINQKLVFKSPLSHQMLHDTIRSWRTADITQTDKENSFHDKF
jgi:hypothetical protein